MSFDIGVSLVSPISGDIISSGLQPFERSAMAASTVFQGKSYRVSSESGKDVADGEVFNGVYRTLNRMSIDVKDGVKNPNWRYQIRSHAQAGTPYTRSITSGGFVNGNISGTYRFGVDDRNTREDRLYGQLFLDNGPAVPTLPSFPLLDVNARTNFISKCRKSQRQFQGGVFLGELLSTIRMIARPGAALRRGMSAYLAEAKQVVRRNHYTDRGRILTKTWLEHSYGWRPLIKDMEDGIVALADVNHYIPDIIVGVAADKVFSEPVRRTTSASGCFLNATASFREVRSGSVRYLGCVAWESTNKAKEYESPKWGLTFSDFVPTIWELLPYSFVVDAFSNIGAVLDASSYGSVNLRWGVRSSITNATVIMGGIKSTFTSTSAHKQKSSASLSLSPLTRMTFSRSLVNSVGVSLMDMHFKVPGVGDWRKWANLAALAIDKSY